MGFAESFDGGRLLVRIRDDRHLNAQTFLFSGG